MEDLQSLKIHCRRFIRQSVQIIIENMETLADSPCFISTVDENGQQRIVKSKTKNWWAIPLELQMKIFNSPVGLVFLQYVEQTDPFKGSIGKTLWVFQGKIGMGTSLSSFEISRMILSSYLSQSDLNRWNNALFNSIWESALRVFDPNVKELEYSLYCPIYSVEFERSSLNLNEELVIQRLDGKTIADLASRHFALRGFQLDQTTYWARYYFIQKDIFFPKELVDGLDPDFPSVRKPYQLALSNELVFLRCFFAERAALVHYEYVSNEKLLNSGIGEVNEMRWRTGLSHSIDHHRPTKTQLEKYLNRRSKLLKLIENSKKDNIITSMRRFAVAWENGFKADILADLVSALELLTVGSGAEVSYTLRVRIAHFLGKTKEEKGEIFSNLKQAYDYRSEIFHGGYYIDTTDEIDPRIFQKDKKAREAVKIINEINRLIPIIAEYYRQLLFFMIDNDLIEIDWKSMSL